MKPRKDSDMMNEGIDHIICKLCNRKFRQISGGHLKKHGTNTKKYKEKFGETTCQDFLNDISKRVKGDKNPAYQHNGKLSPFSKNFIKYKDLDENDLNHKRNEVISKAQKNLTPDKRTTNIEYWLKRGLNEKESKILLSERQNTFSLEGLIKKHGEKEGTCIWQNRQNKWQKTLNSKSDEEIQKINEKKATKINFQTLWNSSLKDTGILYCIKLSNNLTKIGITSRSIEKRYNQKQRKEIKEIKILENTIHHCFMVEQLIKKKFKHITKSKRKEGFGYLEIFENNFDEVFNYMFELFNDSNLKIIFEEAYGKNNRINLYR